MGRKLKLRSADGFPVFQVLVLSLTIVILIGSKWDSIDSHFKQHYDNDDDNDGILDESDMCPRGREGWTSTPLYDWDSDGCHDWFEDYDDDGDGVSDSDDVFPLDYQEWLDTDGDGIGNNADPDDDGDSCVDAIDVFPLNSGECYDTDLDGIGNNADTDADGDGICDPNSGPNGGPCTENIWPSLNPLLGESWRLDAFPEDPTEWADTDDDGIGDNADTDADGDGASDLLEEACGTNPYSIWFSSEGEWTGTETPLDTDYDGLCNRLDPDDDNDGIPDEYENDDILDGISEYDNCILTHNPDQFDLDEDGIGDACDPDIDGDGIENNFDWEDYGNGMVSIDFTYFSIWDNGSYDWGGGFPDVYAFVGFSPSGCEDPTTADWTYNDGTNQNLPEYTFYIQHDSAQLTNWWHLTWDISEYSYEDGEISICVSVQIIDEDDGWDDELDYVDDSTSPEPGEHSSYVFIVNLSSNSVHQFSYDNRGENDLSIMVEFVIYATTGDNIGGPNV